MGVIDDPTILRSLLERAMLAGGRQPSLLTREWHCEGSCSDPVHREISGVLWPQYKDRRIRVIERDHNNPMHFIDLYVPCRRCVDCLRYRAYLWRGRALTELSVANRTWFGTLTLSPDMHYRAKLQAIAKFGEIEALSPDQEFKARHWAISKDITKFLKRLRKQQGCPGGLRYCLVAEKHKSGMPHYHMLLHEVSPDHPLRKAKLHLQWGHGFSSWKIADEKSAGYVTKYLTKSAAARVRASVAYGRSPED